MKTASSFTPEDVSAVASLLTFFNSFFKNYTCDTRRDLKGYVANPAMAEQAEELREALALVPEHMDDLHQVLAVAQHVRLQMVTVLKENLNLTSATDLQALRHQIGMQRKDPSTKVASMGQLDDLEKLLEFEDDVAGDRAEGTARESTSEVEKVVATSPPAHLLSSSQEGETGSPEEELLSQVKRFPLTCANLCATITLTLEAAVKKGITSFETPRNSPREALLELIKNLKEHLPLEDLEQAQVLNKIEEGTVELRKNNLDKSFGHFKKCWDLLEPFKLVLFKDLLKRGQLASESVEDKDVVRRFFLSFLFSQFVFVFFSF